MSTAVWGLEHEVNPWNDCCVGVNRLNRHRSSGRGIGSDAVWTGMTRHVRVTALIPGARLPCCLAGSPHLRLLTHARHSRRSE
jgi:hypothetical protein